MSRRTADANKAIRQAWEREQNLVKEGKGTRDWTEEQQRDILNPDKGKAYDDKGRAFEGQHMKSVGKYPEFQGNPDNIQFLTKDEHLEAHRGSWQNPTNGMYNPATKEFINFGEEELVPCPVIQLSNPIAIIASKTDMAMENTEKEQISETKKKRELGSAKKKNKKSSASKETNSTISPKSSRKMVGGLKVVVQYVVDHPVQILELAGVVISGTVKFVSPFMGNRIRRNGRHTSNTTTNSNSSNKTDIITQAVNRTKKTNRTPPQEHVVAEHQQLYHTKNGPVLKNKKPYHRGGKNS